MKPGRIACVLSRLCKYSIHSILPIRPTPTNAGGIPVPRICKLGGSCWAIPTSTGGPRFRTWLDEGRILPGTPAASSGGPRLVGADGASAAAVHRRRRPSLMDVSASYYCGSTSPRSCPCLVGGAGYHFQVSPTKVSPDQAGPVPSHPLE